MNQCIKHIGYSHILSIFRKIPNRTTIVSVGSGNGVFEKNLDRDIRSDIICVDPNFNNFNKCKEVNQTKKPLFKTTDDLLKSGIKDTHTLILNWTLPNDSSYDYESIVKLNPENVFVLCDLTGTGGSSHLLSWLSFQGIYIPDSSYIMRKYPHPEPKYFPRESITKCSSDNFHFRTKFCAVWLSKEEGEHHCEHIPTIFDELPSVDGCVTS